MEEQSMVRLHCKVQNYDWGRIGELSEVGQLHSLMSGEPIAKDLPYAELWMGTHPSAPSSVLGSEHDEIPLRAWLHDHPEALGDRILRRWDGDLPFLFKVLSVAKALSIQAHPDKKLAQLLHKNHPNIYKDANHKPELALALTPFEALCGFVSSEELKETLESIPELAEALGEEIVHSLVSDESTDDPKAILKSAFTRLMTLEQAIVSGAISRLVTRLSLKSKSEELSPREKLLLSLQEQYPGDVGVLSSLFLNYTKLAPGQAVFLGANEPHAYLSGECVECMATSDNVVRAGLTPKFRDTQTLCSMLTYKQGQAEVLDGCEVDSFTRRYSPPSDEFEVDHVTVPVGETVKLSAPCGPSIFLVYRGVGVVSRVGEKGSIIAGLVRGNIFLLLDGKEVEVSAVVEPEAVSDTPLQLYRAGVSSRLVSQWD